jgi:hypothetical protein
MAITFHQRSILRLQKPGEAHYYSTGNVHFVQIFEYTVSHDPAPLRMTWSGCVDAHPIPAPKRNLL